MSGTIRPPDAVDLAWLLGRPGLGLRQVGGPDPAGVRVRWVHPVELEDPTPWLSGGELVLATGLRLPRGTAAIAEYVRRLADAGIAAYGFGTGLRFARVPRAIEQTCEEVGLPLIEVPLATPFAVVVRAVADELAAQRRQGLERAARFQRRLVDAVLGEGLAGLVDVTAAELGWEVVLLDAFDDVVAASADRPALVEAVRSEIAHGPRSASLSVTTSDGHLAVLRIGSPARSLGWLAVGSVHAPDPAERLLLNQVAAMAALQSTRSDDLDARYRRLGAAVLGQVFGHEPAAFDLSAFGFGATDRVRVVVAEPGRGRPDVADAFDRVLTGRRVRHVGRVEDGRALVVVPGDVDESAALAWLADLGRPDVVLGFGDVTRPVRAGESATQARRAAAQARLGRRRVGWYGTFGLEDLVDEPVVRDRILDLAGTGLTDLLDAEGARERELVRTLRVYLEHHGSWESASRALGVHRHTLRQRIDRIGQLTGADLDHPHQRAAALLAILAHDRD